MSQYKTCFKCLQLLATDNFHKKKTGKFGVTGTCRACQSVIGKNWRDKNKDRKKIMDRNWVLKNPDRIRANQLKWEAKNADKERIRKAKLYQDNKELWRKRSSEWAKANKDKENQKKRNWRKNNPEKNKAHQIRSAKSIKQNGIYQISEKDMTKLLGAKKCFYCQETMTTVTIDHVIPRSKGGRHAIGNLLSCCGSCNSSKGAKTIMQWRIRKMKF